ncbi:FxsB family cyclophane-forming radical SAM/SPASM peptide maturase [Streptomyces justiciae]|uniref:FxsB family cyclophane-forming radical SAM/SPASM peptide maturase n=1 Tax=Streptomyces justiciae TaxID=2780140 RepID=UPI00187E3407|nr:FxsB family cyclophane-forming radical SAM/SPASM peptide maturase [Streptomyces justiciae]MBE8473471.1 FxsB family radical SAM/SPASM domain protein [Streptomyces justiciae]
MTAGTRAFRQFVLKMHSRCDLACDHCYVYRHADQSWRRRPPVIPDEVVAAVVSRIAEHARAHPELPGVHVVLHGGEPLLAGPERLARTARELRSALDGVCALDLRMQTNGLRLDESTCRMLVRERISTGISLDGDRASNDRHRKRAGGGGSYDAVVRAVRLIGSPEHRSAFAGLLCTIDVQNDPVAVYEALAALDPPRVDFLLPHATWDRPPPRDPARPAAHARWLITVHDRWAADGRPFPVRLFDSIEAGRDGQESFTEALGLGSPDLVVVETDGEIEQADWLKTAGPGAPSTGFHVLRNSFDEAAAHPGFLAQSGGVERLSRRCRDCSVVRICGGGLYGHRHRAANGFDNPSVYCEDLFRLIGHVLNAPRSRPARRTHTLTIHGFNSLAAGDGDSAALRALTEAEASVRRMLLAAVCARHPGPEARALAHLDRHRPVQTAQTVRHPHLGTWAVRSAEGRLPAAAVRQRLGEIALAVALRAGTDLRVDLPEGAAQAHLPGTGHLTLPDGPGPVALLARAGRLLVAAGPDRRPRPLTEAADSGFVWHPLRRLATREFSVLVEDADPCRDGFSAHPAPTLDEAEHARWLRLFTEAAVHLRARHAGRGPGVRALFTACTPLRGTGPHGLVAVDPHAFGALGVALPDTAVVLAGLVVEGVQQMKFNALSDLFDLAGSDEARELLRSAYLDRLPAGAIPDDGLTAAGLRMADRLRG